MSLTQVQRSLVRHLRDCEVSLPVSGSYVAGEWVSTGSQEPVEVKLAHFPLSFKDLKIMPEGNYTTQDRVFYQIGNAITIPVDSEITTDGATFTIKTIKDRIFDGGFMKYVGKRKIT